MRRFRRSFIWFGPDIPCAMPAGPEKEGFLIPPFTERIRVFPSSGNGSYGLWMVRLLSMTIVNRKQPQDVSDIPTPRSLFSEDTPELESGRLSVPGEWSQSFGGSADTSTPREYIDPRIDLCELLGGDKQGLDMVLDTCKRSTPTPELARHGCKSHPVLNVQVVAQRGFPSQS